jgi:hypothetical protein
MSSKGAFAFPRMTRHRIFDVGTTINYKKKKYKRDTAIPAA